VSFGAGEAYLMASLEAMAAAQSAPGPEWVRDLYWQVASGLMSGDEAARILVEHYRREYPRAFEIA
jgi:hypothetical protein